jgi:hypothetical protein
MEQIYTIPINEVFDEVKENPACGCPVCRLSRRLEENELDLILGASMMEPDIRIRTNEEGFCGTHYEKMLGMKNRLGLALMLESHLDEVKKELHPSALSALVGKKHEAPMKHMDKMRSSCYICGKVSYHVARMLSNLMELYERDGAFREKYAAMPYFCIPHAKALLDAARKSMASKSFGAFYDATMKIETAYLDSLREDVSWFCKKFDYRYAEEPWGNAKDAPVRAAAFLTGKKD